MLKVEELGKYVDVLDIPEDWYTYYDEAVNSFDESWYNAEELENIISYYNFDEEFTENLRDLWYIVNCDINLIFLVYLWYYILYKAKISKRTKWKYNLNYFRNNGSLYMPVLSMLMGYKIHEDNMCNYDEEQRNIQKKIIKDICTFDEDVYNIPGMRFSNMEWGSRFIRGQIIQMGILQYELKKEFLDGNDVIFIHIPRGAKLTKENVEASFKNKDKVIKLFNVSKDILFVCESWLLSEELRDILDDDSNILNFQKYFNIIELKENTSDFVKFIFNEPFNVDNYELLKEDNKLQKRIKDKLIKNETLHIGFGILKDI